MKFNIKEIGPNGRAVRERLDEHQVQGMLRQVQMQGLPRSGQLEINLQLTRVERTVFVRGSLMGGYTVICSRCLGPCQVQVQHPQLRLTYLPSDLTVGGEPDPGETELELQDLETYTHDGETLDLEPLIRESLVLSLPMAPVCSESCRGLCGGCGANLNQETCSCADSQADASPWVAALNKIRLEETGD